MAHTVMAYGSHGPVQVMTDQVYIVMAGIGYGRSGLYSHGPYSYGLYSYGRYRR